MGDFKKNDDYQEVADRIVKFYEAFPDGRLESCVRFEVLPIPRGVKVPLSTMEDPDDPGSRIVATQVLDHQVLVVCEARAYRTADDPTPCVGIASEPFPGLTPYTRDSEVQNAETSAWGRAIVATGCTGTKKVASANDVRNRRNDDGEMEPSPRDKAKATQARSRARRAAPPAPSGAEEAPGVSEAPPTPSIQEEAPETAPEATGEQDLPETFAVGATTPPPPGVEPTGEIVDPLALQRDRVLQLIANLTPEQQTTLRVAWKAEGLPKPTDLEDPDDFDVVDRLVGDVWQS